MWHVIWLQECVQEWLDSFRSSNRPRSIWVFFRKLVSVADNERYVDAMSGWCWATVADGGPASTRHCVRIWRGSRATKQGLAWMRDWQGNEVSGGQGNSLWQPASDNQSSGWQAIETREKKERWKNRGPCEIIRAVQSIIFVDELIRRAGSRPDWTATPAECSLQIASPTVHPARKSARLVAIYSQCAMPLADLSTPLWSSANTVWSPAWFVCM